MKIISISDVITNSSSEVFCIIKSDNKDILQEIFEELDGLGDSEDGEGGTYLEDSEITVWFSYDAWNSGLEKLFRPGIEKLLEPWKNKYSISYEDY